MSNVKNHQKVGKADKVSYKRWIEFRELMDEALDHISVREVATRLKKDGPGWAGKARDHRAIVSEKDVVDMEELVAGLRKESGKEEKPTPVRESTKPKDNTAERHDRFRNVVSQLRDSGVGDEAIARAMDYERAREVNRLLNTPGIAPPLGRIVMLEASVPTLVGNLHLRNGTDPAPEEETEEPVRPAARESTSASLARVREKLLEAAQAAEEAKEVYPAMFAGVLDSYRDRIVDLASDME